MDAPRPEDFGLTDEEVARVQARHDQIGRRLVLTPLVLAFTAALVTFATVCRDCSPLAVLVLALGLTAFAGSLCGVVAAIAVAGLYPPLARRWSPAYRAVCRFTDALEHHRGGREGLS